MTPEKAFLHRLALALGKTVGELRDTMTAHEFVDWQRYAAHHPFPAEVVDIQGAQVVCMLANIHRDTNTAMREPVEFMVLRSRAPRGPARPRVMTEADRVRAVLSGGGDHGR